MIKPGILINDRYQIIEKIGTGGMSVVYKARCTKLERFVAIKVLREEYCFDEEFVKRFKVEARSAASLSHSNIVNIYDVGNENKTHFIVMEYLEGRSLKEYIKEKGRLDDAETMKISACIASALECAHTNHIIHRDIKPQNIIITHDGKVKVADFGIARVASESTIAISDVTTGSVHYIAPEQARGGFCDEKSDVYSLGITMYEMITGEMPFIADSAVSVALKHIHDPFPLPSIKNPQINKSLEQIILKATQKKPEMRYLSAEKLLTDLKKAQDFPNDAFVSINTFNDDSPTLNISTSELEQINNTQEKSKNKVMDKVVVSLGLISAVILVAIIAIVSYNIYSKSKLNDLPKDINIPALEGLLLEDAVALLEENNISYTVAPYEFSKFASKDHIIRQSKSGTIAVEKDETLVVELVVSKGEEVFQVPDVSNLEFDEAERIIRENGFMAKRILQNHDIIAMGVVIDQEPNSSEKAAPNAIITIYVSQGKEKQYVEMPDLTLKTEADGKKALTDLHLVPGNVTYVNNEIVPEGQIIMTNVEVGTQVEEGYVVNLVVSQGKQMVTKTLTINSIFSEEQTTGLVEVRLILDSGEDTVVFSSTVTYDQFPLIISVGGIGKGTIEVYLDGNKEYTNGINFDEVEN
ncbi:MAG: Stk1 family PASTA domain-containing Ser/Thr kinase [Vallitaleaceae bacterium]|nr:Stk1 family PASTA domain-containing Ser/Thr kinase [Vallitaleaceae bacterium]